MPLVARILQVNYGYYPSMLAGKHFIELFVVWGLFGLAYGLIGHQSGN